MIYDTIQSTNEIVAIDTKDLTVKSRFPVAPSGAPTSITMDSAKRGDCLSAAEIPRCS